VVDGGQRSYSVIRQRPWITAFMPSWQTRKNAFTMQGVGYPVSAAGQGEQAGPQASSSCDRSSVEVGTLASTEFTASRRNTAKGTNRQHEHDDHNKQNQFCYVCSMYAPPNIRKNITDVACTAYSYCFSNDVSNQDKNWVPHIMCAICYNMIISCYKKKDFSDLKYSSPVVWRMPDSKEDCFFLLDRHAWI